MNPDDTIATLTESHEYGGRPSLFCVENWADDQADDVAKWHVKGRNRLLGPTATMTERHVLMRICSCREFEFPSPWLISQLAISVLDTMCAFSW